MMLAIDICFVAAQQTCLPGDQLLPSVCAGKGMPRFTYSLGACPDLQKHCTSSTMSLPHACRIEMSRCFITSCWALLRRWRQSSTPPQLAGHASTTTSCSDDRGACTSASSVRDAQSGTLVSCSLRQHEFGLEQAASQSMPPVACPQQEGSCLRIHQCMLAG